MRRTGIHPINHILTVKSDLIAAHPWLAEELLDVFSRAREIAIADGAEAPPEYGLEKNRASLQLGMQFSAEQQITPRVYGVDEMFCPA
jgi:4,5-dihydroxyphthalate decarboxylase